MTRHHKYQYRQSVARVLDRTGVVGARQNQPNDQGTLLLPQALALAVLTLAHAFDYTSFLFMVERHGLGAEANPIVVQIAQQAGLPGLTLAKVATVGFAALLMVIIAPKRRRLAMALLMFGIGAGLVGGISNVATL